MEKEFKDWYKENEPRFHSGQFNEKQIAYSAWLEGRKTSLPLAEMEKRLDEALANETPETLNEWLRSETDRFVNGFNNPL